LLSDGATHDERSAAGPARACQGSHVPSEWIGGCADSRASDERLTEPTRVLLEADPGGVLELARDFGVIDGKGRDVIDGDAAVFRGLGSARVGDLHFDRWGRDVRDWRRHRRELASASCERQDDEEKRAVTHGVRNVGHIRARDTLRIRRAAGSDVGGNTWGRHAVIRRHVRRLDGLTLCSPP
jgi:hypothetical protein